MTMSNRSAYFSITIFLVVLLPSVLAPVAASARDEPIPRIGGHAEGGHAVIDGDYGDQESDPGPPFGNHKPADDVPRLTNSSDVSPAALAYANDDLCDGTTSHTEVLPDGTESEPFVCAHFSRAGTTAPTGYVPTTREILYYAATTIHADGAGLHKRPTDVSYTNKYVPTLVAATHPTQTHVVTMFGREVTVTFTATSYTWNWGDDTPDLISTSPGTPWRKGMDPNTDPALIRHYYTPPGGWRSRFDGPYPNATRTITLTTTWAGTATNPFTGETQTINGLVTTTETTGPFPLSHLLISNTDTWEEKQGH